MQARSRICSGFRAALSADLLGQRQDAASHPVAVENADMRLTLQVNGFDKHSDKLAENFEVPLEAAEDLRELFEGLPEVFPYFFDEFQISTLEQLTAIQRWCPEKHLKLEEVDSFIGVV